MSIEDKSITSVLLDQLDADFATYRKFADSFLPNYELLKIQLLSKLPNSVTKITAETQTPNQMEEYEATIKKMNTLENTAEALMREKALLENIILMSESVKDSPVQTSTYVMINSPKMNFVSPFIKVVDDKYTCV